MSRHERTGKRDLTYSQWHRTLSDQCAMVDIDSLEYCANCYAPLALIETAQGIGQEKNAAATAHLAIAARIPSYVALYETDSVGTITRFLVRRDVPKPKKPPRKLTPAEMQQFIESIHEDHEKHGCAR